jgi:hypothetical protein
MPNGYKKYLMEIPKETINMLDRRKPKRKLLARAGSERRRLSIPRRL